MFKKLSIDGYIIPKNDEFFSEYSKKDRLKIITNFSGSAGYAIILKNKNYLFVDGRYTIQAQLESGKNFKIEKYQKIINCSLFKNLTIGIDPKLFTSNQIKNFFSKYNNTKQIPLNLIDRFCQKKNHVSKPFFSLNKKIVGRSHFEKIGEISKFLKKRGAKYLFISAPENVAWVLNIRGFDNPNSPIPNCHLIVSDKKKINIISEKSKLKKLIKEKKINHKQIIEIQKLEKSFKKFKKGKIIIDNKTCSIFYEKLLKKNLMLSKRRSSIFFKINQT